MGHSDAIQTKGLKNRIHHDAERIDETFRVGVEIEACLIDKNGMPVNAEPLIKEHQGTSHPLDYEYGACQFEYKTSPVAMSDLLYLNCIFEDFIEHLGKSIEKLYRNNDVIPVFLGGNPSPEIMKSVDLITNKPRYNKLSEWHNKMPDVEIEGQIFKAMHIPGAIQAFHFHLQGKNPNYTAMMFNHILNMIPSAITLGANSRLFAGRVFSFHEPRIYLYDQSEQQNSGFPAISKYLGSIEDYVDYISSRKPNIAKDYFELEKERHEDARIRLNSDFYRVETRVVSVQPTIKELMAMIEFFIGYLSRAIYEERQLRPLSSLREERLAVVRSGYQAETPFDIIETIKGQFDYARKGLSDLGISAEYINILDRRLQNKSTPGDDVVKLWDEKFNGSIRQTIFDVISDIWQRTRNNQPIM